MWGGVLPLAWEDDTMGRPFTPSVEVFKKGDGRLPSVHKLSKERSGEVRGGGWAAEPHRTLRNVSA